MAALASVVNVSETHGAVNRTSGSTTPGSHISLAVVIVVYLSVVVVSVAGNGIVLLSVITCRRMRTVTNCFIVNLAGADLMMAVLCIPFTVIANWLVDRWPFGTAMCPIVPYLQTVVVFLSAFTLVGLSMDRYRAVVYPLRPRITTRQVLGGIAVIWALAIAIPLPVAMFSRVDPVLDLCVEAWPDENWRLAFTASLMALQYFIPLAILLVNYSTICYVIWIKKTPGEAENARDRRLALSKRKTMKMMISMVIIYALCWLPLPLCWLPLHCVTVLGDLHRAIWNFQHIQSVWIACHWLAVSSCCWNPIVYYWTNDTFRAGFMYALGTWCPCVRRQRSAPMHRGQVIYLSTGYLPVDAAWHRRSSTSQRGGQTLSGNSTFSEIVLPVAPTTSEQSRRRRTTSAETLCVGRRTRTFVTGHTSRTDLLETLTPDRIH